jgi:hypothetical protein
MHDHVGIRDERSHGGRIEHVAATVGDLLPAARRRVERPARHAHDLSDLARALERRDHRLPDLPCGAGDRNREASLTGPWLCHRPFVAHRCAPLRSASARGGSG